MVHEVEISVRRLDGYPFKVGTSVGRSSSLSWGLVEPLKVPALVSTPLKPSTIPLVMQLKLEILERL